MAKPPPHKSSSNTTSAPAVEAHDASMQRNTGHPLLKNEAQVMQMLKQWQNLENKEEVVIERIEEWKECVNRLASTPDGQHFLRMMIKFSGLFAPANSRDTVKMVETVGKQAFYLTYVRPYLNLTLRKEIE